MHRKRILWVAVVIPPLVAACVLFVFLGENDAPAATPPEATVVEVIRGTLANSLTVAEQFQSYQQVDLNVKDSGYVRWTKVGIGDLVRNLTNYEQIGAPLTGVVTVRYADPGSLIQEGQDSHIQTLPVTKRSNP